MCGYWIVINYNSKRFSGDIDTYVVSTNSISVLSPRFPLGFALPLGLVACRPLDLSFAVGPACAKELNLN